MDTEAEQLAIIARVLQVLPAGVRDDFAGAAWIKLQELLGAGRGADDVLTALRDHLTYTYRKDRFSKAVDSHDGVIDDRNHIADIEARDELRNLMASLEPTDRAILALIMAGNSRSEAAGILGLSPSTIARRLQRIREAHHED